MLAGVSVAPAQKGGMGQHEATCHPRLGGACEAKAVCGRAGGGRRCRPGPPETRPQAWMARAKGRFVHENGRFGGWRRQKGRFVHENGRFGGWRRQKGSSSTKSAVLVDGGRQETETGMGRLNKKEANSKESASWGGGSRIRIKITKPSRNPCLNDFYCVFLQVEFFDSACFWDIFGIRF